MAFKADHRPFMVALYCIACLIVAILTLANLWWRSVPLGVACMLASAFLFGVGVRNLRGAKRREGE